MGLEFNPEAGKMNGTSGRTPKKVADVKDANGNLRGVPIFTKVKDGQVITYKDFNGDGQFTDNEIMFLEQYTKNADGTKTGRRYIDKDGDGYSDRYIDQTFDKNGNAIGKPKVTVQEDINKVKNRQHLDHEVINRDMRQLETGMMIEDAVTNSGEKTTGTPSVEVHSGTTIINGKPTEVHAYVPVPVSANATGTSGKKTSLANGVTKDNNEYQVYKDSDGKTVMRIDYSNNNDSNIYDEEAVLNSNGSLESLTERYYDDDGTMYYYKHFFDEDGNETKVIETTCNKNGKKTGSKEVPLEENRLTGRGFVHIGVPVDGEWGDSQLRQIAIKYGFPSVVASR